MVCRAELRGLGAEAEKRGIREPVILAVTAHRPDELADFQSKLPASIRLLADPELRTIDAYGLRHEHGSPHHGNIARPAIFVVGRDGRLAFARASDTVLDRLPAEESLDAWESADARR